MSSFPFSSSWHLFLKHMALRVAVRALDLYPQSTSKCWLEFPRHEGDTALTLGTWALLWACHPFANLGVLLGLQELLQKTTGEAWCPSPMWMSQVTQLLTAQCRAGHEHLPSLPRHCCHCENWSNSLLPAPSILCCGCFESHLRSMDSPVPCT